VLEIVAVVGYVAAMTWGTMIAPREAMLPTVIILHGALFLGLLIGNKRHD
jgi:hypothetical protein